jgi:hypothetical protein
MPSRWKQIKAPPPPYARAVRTTTEHGRQVIVAVRRSGPRFEAWPALDQESFLQTIQGEAEAAHLLEAVEARRSICGRYDDGREPVADGPASYHDLDAEHPCRSGGFSRR